MEEQNLNDKIESMSSMELNQLKVFLFKENIRTQTEKKELKDLYDKFLTEKIQFQEEMKLLNSKVLAERTRLKEENLFFDKKMQILKDGFCQLDMDRRQFEREKTKYQNEKRAQRYSDCSDFGSSYFFKGVNGPLGLKKRYKDLIKIFHPDNMCGDGESLVRINEEYERLKRSFEEHREA